MTVPASLNTADRAIRLGMTDAGLLAEGDDPSSEQLAVGLGRLNDIANFWQTQGVRLWLETDLSITLIAGQSTYTFGPAGTVNMTRPTRVKDAGYYLDANNNRRPLTLISRDEYNRLSNVVNTGPLNSYWADKQQTLLSIKFWMTPDAQAALGTAHVVIQQQVVNSVSLTDTMNFPLEWFIALRWAYAEEICTGQPSAVVNRCTGKAAYYKQLLDDWDVEDGSTRFQPDSQSALVYRTR